MADVQQALAEFDCASEVRSAARSLVDAAPSVHLWEGTTDAYVGLAGASDSAIGVYVNKSRLSIALDAAEAQLAATKHALPLENKKTTGYVLIDADRLGDAAMRAVAVELGLRALEQSLGKPAKKPKPHTKQPEAKVPTCPIHHMQLLPDGTCWMCEG